MEIMGLIRFFALCMLTCATTSVAVFAYGSLLCMPPPANARLRNPRTVYYEIAKWLHILILLITTFQVQYSACLKHWAVRSIIFVGVIAVIAPRIVYLVQPTEFLDQLGGFICFAFANYIPLLVLKVVSYRLHKSSPGSVPDQVWSPAFPFVQISMLSYGASYFAPGGWQIVAMGGCVLFAFLSSFAVMFAEYRTGVPPPKKSFEFTLQIYCLMHLTPVLCKIISQALQTSWGARNAVLTVTAVRLVLGGSIVIFEDQTQNVFGRPTLTALIFLKLGEAYASLLATINFSTSSTLAFSFLAVNLLLASVKDAGMFDDVRIWWSLGRCLPLSSTTRHLVVPSTDKDTGSDVSSLSNASVKSGSALVRQHSKNARKKSLSGISTVVAAPLNTATLIAASSTAAAVLERQRSLVPILRKLHTDLANQITRSEQTLVSRTVAVVCVALCFGLVHGWTRATMPVVMVLHTSPLYPGLLLLGSALEIVWARMFVVYVLRWKIRRMHKLWRQVSCVTTPAELAQLSPLRLWQTDFPSDMPGLARASLIAAVFTTSSQFGPWNI
ncbi:hypothetical protein BC828DRAFT_412282 [Blastocladiella britannica]|nr:hypothetical protein BC828DRAFT_412282 [Blastocladiella britannica]